MPTRRALFSLTDRSGAAELAARLADLGFEIFATGGTCAYLGGRGLPVRDSSELTGFGELLGGRVKTLHPAIHAGILANRDEQAHLRQLEEYGLVPFDVVCVNLYDFEGSMGEDDWIEAIDIGGVAMLRAGAKNYRSVLVLLDPLDYHEALADLEAGGSLEFRTRMAAKAFRQTSYYDGLIARRLGQEAGVSPLQEHLTVPLALEARLRYGENPHQQAALYRIPQHRQAIVSVREGGKELGYNNWLDADSAWGLARDLGGGSCVIVKHGNPCGAARAKRPAEAFAAAVAGDPISAYGGIVAFNGAFDKELLDALLSKGSFFEVILARDWAAEAIERFENGPQWARNARLLKGTSHPGGEIELRSIDGYVLAQTRDQLDFGEWRTVTSRQPSKEEQAAARFSWTCVRHVKSNAITVSSEGMLLGVGCGQSNRVLSTRLALEQAGSRAAGKALASDAFFPFPDSIELAAQAKIGCIVQPGGSKNDQKVIDAANERQLAMIFTGVRHFRH